jgi:hypothetical protein
MVAAETDTGVVRMVYHKVRDIRQSRDLDCGRRRNSFQELGEDFHHGVRVCGKARDFLDLAIEGVYKKVGDAGDEQPFKVNQSVARDSAWNELLDFVNTATVKSCAGNEHAFGPQRTISRKSSRSPTKSHSRQWRIQEGADDQSPKKKPFLSGVRSLLHF